ncbi:uncharacterized protein LOC106172957 isoform X1 [Lingula anatina]|uniref:Uncharacterized protein LOC106172957 isoform X1 n=1 Tax=Lingula anatina TaxID=7574 RepID=A0A1S3JGT7_LINAN|nr:uncharacterized protein LOC106172957 isoform X1 [Lingula anatina]|eukprot:XP_013409361.1 uncharacterized protein LOC106172957 isoform X1 [Lingula anatina]
MKEALLGSADTITMETRQKQLEKEKNNEKDLKPDSETSTDKTVTENMKVNSKENWTNGPDKQVQEKENKTTEISSVSVDTTSATTAPSVMARRRGPRAKMSVASPTKTAISDFRERQAAAARGEGSGFVARRVSARKSISDSSHNKQLPKTHESLDQIDELLHGEEAPSEPLIEPDSTTNEAEPLLSAQEPPNLSQNAPLKIDEPKIDTDKNDSLLTQNFSEKFQIFKAKKSLPSLTSFKARKSFPCTFDKVLTGEKPLPQKAKKSFVSRKADEVTMVNLAPLANVKLRLPDIESALGIRPKSVSSSGQRKSTEPESGKTQTDNSNIFEIAKTIGAGLPSDLVETSESVDSQSMDESVDGYSDSSGLSEQTRQKRTALRENARKRDVHWRKKKRSRFGGTYDLFISRKRKAAQLERKRKLKEMESEQQDGEVDRETSLGLAQQTLVNSTQVPSKDTLNFSAIVELLKKPVSAGISPQHISANASPGNTVLSTNSGLPSGPESGVDVVSPSPVDKQESSKWSEWPLSNLRYRLQRLTPQERAKFQLRSKGRRGGRALLGGRAQTNVSDNEEMKSPLRRKKRGRGWPKGVPRKKIVEVQEEKDEHVGDHDDSDKGQDVNLRERTRSRSRGRESKEESEKDRVSTDGTRREENIIKSETLINFNSSLEKNDKPETKWSKTEITAKEAEELEKRREAAKAKGNTTLDEWINSGNATKIRVLKPATIAKMLIDDGGSNTETAQSQTPKEEKIVPDLPKPTLDLIVKSTKAEAESPQDTSGKDKADGTEEEDAETSKTEIGPEKEEIIKSEHTYIDSKEGNDNDDDTDVEIKDLQQYTSNCDTDEELEEGATSDSCSRRSTRLKRKAEVLDDDSGSVSSNNTTNTDVDANRAKRQRTATTESPPVVSLPQTSQMPPVLPSNIIVTVPTHPPQLILATMVSVAPQSGMQVMPVSTLPITTVSSITNVEQVKLRSLLTEPRKVNSAALVTSRSPVVQDVKPATQQTLPPQMFGGVPLPVTPPKTPDTASVASTSSNNSIRSTSPAAATTDKIPSIKKLHPILPAHDRDLIPLCCCKINGTAFANMNRTVYCQALESIDGKITGCCNRVSLSMLVRPAVKIPFMAVCEVHRKRLKLHQCCPGCGIYCSQGKFYQCKKEGGSVIHIFHKECQVFKDSKFYCPHCGEESLQCEVNIRLNEPSSVSMTSSDLVRKTKPSPSKARMSWSELKDAKSEGLDLNEEVFSHTFKSGKTLSTAGMRPGAFKGDIKRLVELLEMERPKKYRALPKNIYIPVKAQETEKVLFMLADGAEPNEKFEENNGQTVLHVAAESGQRLMVYLLLQAGASPNVSDKDFYTPLMRAAENNHVEIMEDLIRAGAEVQAKGEDGMTCLHVAARSGHLESIKYLLTVDQVDINVKDDGGWSPIVWASEHSHVETVKYMLDHGADPNMRDNEENIALHWAAFSGSIDIAELFLNYGCDLESVNEHGDKPLHIAARQDHYESVVLFLARGADSEARNREEETPLSCCPNRDSPTCLALRVNRHLRSLAMAKRIQRPERLLHRDISLGREQNVIACVNAIDDYDYPRDFVYVIENVQTEPMNINNLITSLQHCKCRDDCASLLCNCSRNSVRCWFDKEGRLVPEFNQAEPPLLFECNKACSCWMTCRNRVVQNGISTRLQLFRTNGRGWGVRTLQDVPQGTFICEYIGELISDSEADRREDDSYLFDLDNKDGETYCIDARHYGNVSRFINHLCEPNVIPVKVFIEHQDLRFPRICFFASRDIKSGEELGFDYGEKFWIIKWKQFTCACQSPKCKYNSTTIHRTIEEYNARQEEEHGE